MSTLTWHGNVRMKERGVMDKLRDVFFKKAEPKAIPSITSKGISLSDRKMLEELAESQRDILVETRNIIAPALQASSKKLSFDIGTRSFTASPGRISTILKLGSTTLVIGMEGNKSPVVVTCWQN